VVIDVSVGAVGDSASRAPVRRVDLGRARTGGWVADLAGVLPARWGFGRWGLIIEWAEFQTCL
jgi:hypothetical protein